ncbi:hypothetical protein V6N13_135177 [Hibiscus sabdariffa]
MASVTAELADLRLEEEEEEVAIAVSSDSEGMGNLRNQSQIVSYEQIAEKWDVVALKGKLTTATNVKSIPMNIPRRGRAHNLSNKPNNLPVDMAIDQGEEDNPIICQDGLKRDSLSITRKLQSKECDISEVSALIWDVQQLSKSLHACSFLHILRSGNKVAHLLAKSDSLGPDDRFWVEEVPSVVQQAVAEDRRLLDPP